MAAWRARGDLLGGTALAALVSCGLFAFSTPVAAQVSGVRGGVVVAGQATIANTAPGQVTVNQSSARGVIDWHSFSIGSGERVDFQQPSASAVTLNRVTGPDPSVIAGRLTATGQLILVNGAGIVFSSGSQVNAAGLIASTANVVDPQRFMQGGTVAFDRPSANPNAGVVNAGTITVSDGGLVGLVGNTASNSGTINARLGRVTIGGAETFTVDLAGDGLINFQLGDPVSRQPVDAQGNKRPLAANTGTINADGGVVTLSARAARGVVDNVVNAGGTINARAVRNDGGVVVFGADEGTVNVTGTVDVSGAAAGQRGGQVVATAAKGTVNVAASARINASGGSGGGTVLVGGGKQGQGPIANAKNTTVAPGASINADATHQGHGGTVVVWADNATVFGGSISAKGGPQGGDGGFAEVSGKVFLDFNGLVDLRSARGATGTLLLDPSDITISDGTNDTSQTG
ncbi:filamentous hemagglutinin N-terminal domain-containing protein, partial [Vineibacter terrae]|uniref:two-partner secretion domain-containing protein n=1 Tax=Vineibacter terrae TaxID=2586908 RepID=UPI002E373B7B